MLTTGEVARRLGVSSQTVRRLIAAGELPALQAGKHYRVKAGDLAAFIAARQR